MDELLANSNKYEVIVDNDSVSVWEKGDDGNFLERFSEIDYHLINQIFNYLGVTSSLA